MAKSTKTKSKSTPRLPTLQVPCSAEVKMAIEDLAHAYRKDVKSLLLPLIESFIEVNHSQLEAYRQLAEAVPLMPFDEPTKKPTAKKTRKSKKIVDDTAAQVDKKSANEGGGSNENS